jgi:hypothetical protein
MSTFTTADANPLRLEDLTRKGVPLRSKERTILSVLVVRSLLNSPRLTEKRKIRIAVKIIVIQMWLNSSGRHRLCDIGLTREEFHSWKSLVGL